MAKGKKFIKANQAHKRYPFQWIWSFQFQSKHLAERLVWEHSSQSIGWINKTFELKSLDLFCDFEKIWVNANLIVI